MAESEFTFSDLIKGVFLELKEILRTEQRLSPKLNALFGLIAAFLTFVLLVPSELREIVALIQTVRGKQVDETPAWALMAALLSLILYFFACVWLSSRPVPPRHTPKAS